MRQLKDFDLLIDRSETGYRARVLHSPAGAGQTVDLDFGWRSSDHLPWLLSELGRTRSGTRSSPNSKQRQAARELGSHLHRAILSDEVGAAFRESALITRARQEGVRLRLQFAKKVPELLDLPWEFLYDEREGRFLVLSDWTPIVRYPVGPQSIELEPIEPPLRILVAISQAVPDGGAELDTDREWEYLNDRALGAARRNGLVSLHRVGGEFNEIDRALKQTDYHVFHYIGHSGLGDSGGVLYLEGPGGGAPMKRSGNDLASRMDDFRSLRLAVFNSCEGARTTEKDPYAGVALSFIQKGLPAVIGMQFEVTDDAAIDFSREFYTSIAGGDPIDHAVAQARQHLFGLNNDVEWGTPVLYQLAENGRLFEFGSGSDSAIHRFGRLAELYDRGRDFAAAQQWSEAAAVFAEIVEAEPAYLDADRRLSDAQSRGAAGGDDDATEVSPGPKPSTGRADWAPYVLIGLILVVIIVIVVGVLSAGN